MLVDCLLGTYVVHIYHYSFPDFCTRRALLSFPTQRPKAAVHLPDPASGSAVLHVAGWYSETWTMSPPCLGSSCSSNKDNLYPCRRLLPRSSTPQYSFSILSLSFRSVIRTIIRTVFMAHQMRNNASNLFQLSISCRTSAAVHIPSDDVGSLCLPASGSASIHYSDGGN